MLYTTITTDNIRIFVETFYKNIINDEQLAHHFTDILGDDLQNKPWQEHIELLADFWATMVLKEDSYSGSAFAPHIKMNLSKNDFDSWLNVLDNTLMEIYDVSLHKTFKEIGEIMSKNFLKRLNIE